MTNKTTRKKELTEFIQIRVSEFEKNRIKWLSQKYAGGNISLYLVWSAMNANRIEIKPEILSDYSKRRKVKESVI